MKVVVTSSYSGKVSSGEFENINPFFSAGIETDLPDGTSLDDFINTTQKHLQSICYGNFKLVAEKARIEKIKKDMSGFRFRELNGEFLPSVTTIISPDFKAWVDDEQMKIAVSEGNINHARAAHFIKTGEWVDPVHLTGVANDILILKGRFIDSWNFPAFVDKYKPKDMKNGVEIYNTSHKYSGEYDAECLYPLNGEKEAELVPTIIDFKRTPDKHKNFTQMSAYARCEGMENIKQMMIIPCNPDNEQGFSKPIVSQSIDKYFEVFLHKRNEFRKTYGI